MALLVACPFLRLAVVVFIAETEREKEREREGDRDRQADRDRQIDRQPSALVTKRVRVTERQIILCVDEYLHIQGDRHCLSFDAFLPIFVLFIVRCGG